MTARALIEPYRPNCPRILTDLEPFLSVLTFLCVDLMMLQLDQRKPIHSPATLPARSTVDFFSRTSRPIPSLRISQARNTLSATRRSNCPGEYARRSIVDNTNFVVKALNRLRFIDRTSRSMSALDASLLRS